jgi:hypothetical protein
MELPDFLRSVEFERLRQLMGARVSDYFGVQPAGANEVIETEGFIEVQLFNDQLVVDNTLQYLGRDVICYMRNQNVYQINEHNLSSFKFHLTFCNAISGAINARRDTRFRLHRRRDNVFEVYPVVGGLVANQPVQVAMKVCGSCLRSVRYPGYANGTPGQRQQIIDTFDIANYLDHGIRGIAARVAEPMIRLDRELAIVQRSNKRCNQCNRNLAAHPQWLKVHHRNGLPFDFRRDNTQVLCLECYVGRNGIGNNAMAYQNFRRHYHID